MLKRPQTASLVEVPNSGLVSLIDKIITVYCSAYIYTGKLVGVNDSCIELADAKIVYDTGSFTNKDWTTSEKFPGSGQWFIQLTAIESFGLLK